MSRNNELTESERDQVVTLLGALETGWIVVDEEADFDYVLLFDESRTEMENFKPSKRLIRMIENMGLIKDKDATFGSRSRETGVHYEASAPDWVLNVVKTLLPIVYFYDVTSAGRSFLDSERNLKA
jgi:hypothetical protein